LDPSAKERRRVNPSTLCGSSGIQPIFAGGSVLSLRVLGKIENTETIAVGRQIRELPRLIRIYGPGRWRKRKGIAMVRLPDRSMVKGEVHWYEAHGLGRKEFKLKRIIGEE
jgi:hypothetical protein